MGEQRHECKKVYIFRQVRPFPLARPRATLQEMNETYAPFLPDESLTPHDSFLRSERAASQAEPRDPTLREYWKRGYIALRGLFSAEEIAGWSDECNRLLQSEYVRPDNIRSPFRMNSGEYPERIDPVVDISPVFSDLVHDARIISVVESIFADKALLFKDKLIFKAPGTRGYTMHQDQAWWQLCPADDILSVSIQIDGANAANGCIELFPGAHGRMLTPPGARTNFRPEELAQVDASTGQKIETQPGDVLIFHSLAPHQSGTNTAEVFRRSFYLTYSAARGGDFYAQQLENYKKYSPSEKQTYFR